MPRHHSPSAPLLPELTLLPLLALLAVIAVAAAQIACGGGSVEASPEQAALGKLHFDRVCATCHGRDAHGLPKQGKDLHDNAFIHSLDDDGLVAFLKVGRPATHELNTRGVDMPPKGGDPTMTDDHLRQIVAFLRTL